MDIFNIITWIFIWFFIIVGICMICNLIFELYMYTLTDNEQDKVINKINKTLTEIKNKFNNFWK